MIQPLRANGPGWRLEIPNGVEYIVWAPRSWEYHEDHYRQEVAYSTLHPTRDDWVADWSDPTGFYGQGERGGSMDEVLKIFPEEIAEQFRVVIAKEGLV